MWITLKDDVTIQRTPKQGKNIILVVTVSNIQDDVIEDGLFARPFWRKKGWHHSVTTGQI